jgi:hypothetical protein
MSNLVYIWDVLHQDYWLPDQSGHTPHKGEAGKYERTEAEKIEAKFYMNEEDVIWRPLTFMAVAQPKPTELTCQ